MVVNAVIDDVYWMRAALREAEKAAFSHEIPVGAVLVENGQILAANHNRTREKESPLAHAEMLVLQTAQKSGRKYFEKSTLYVTLEPCIMCAGALWLARIGRLVYGCRDAKAGACGSLFNFPQDRRLNHRFPVEGGILAEECALLLQDFFRKKRG